MTSARMRCASVVAVLGMALAVFAAGARTRQATAEWKAKGVHTAHAGISSASGSLCDSCIWILKTARCEASDPDAQAALISLALSEVCDKLGGELAAQCSQLVPQLVPVAIMMLGSYSSRELCADMSLCSAAAPQRLYTPQHLQLRASSGSSMCKYLAGRAGGALSLKQACAELPAEFHAQCEALASSTGETLLSASNSTDASTACMASGVCTADMLDALLRTSLPPLPAEAVSSLHALHARVSPSADMCDTCKLAVLEAAAILGNVATQKQILEYAKQMCSSLTTFHDQCLAYVELYGPLVFNMLVQYLTPELCITLSYCPPITPGMQNVMYVS